MKGLTQHILEKLKVATTPLNIKINYTQFFETVFNYCKRNDTPEIIALNIYEEVDNIPEMYIDPDDNKCRVNFALRPQGRNKIANLEIWEYSLKNEPIAMLISVKADDYGFWFLKNKVFDEEIISDIYNYCA